MALLASAKRRRVDAAVFLDAVTRPCPKLVGGPVGSGHADHRSVKATTLYHRLQRRENLLVGQISGRAEEDQGVGVRIAHSFLLFSRGYLPATFSMCPPNS